LAKDQKVRLNTTAERRDRLREALIDAAERAIGKGGLTELRARTLAEDAGCAVGAIYNVVDDLDELVLLANMRTLAALERELTAAGDAPRTASSGSEAAIAQLVRLALAYLAFAANNMPRWRALFDHRMPGREVPEWYRRDQQRLFRHVEEPLRALLPGATAKRRALLARSLFSAVHGLVVLGLEEKLQAIPPPALREQITFILTALGRGMASAE
jgi:AcrR family transcriptional regulator